MKQILLIFTLLISAVCHAQIVGEVRPYDSTKIWLTAPSKESFRIIPADTSKCKHIYIAVEQPEVKVDPVPNSMLAIGVYPRYGKHEGKELICVKCFHTRKQIIDYGDGSGYYFPNTNVIDTMSISKAQIFKRFAKESTLVIPSKIKE